MQEVFHPPGTEVDLSDLIALSIVVPAFAVTCVAAWRRRYRAALLIWTAAIIAVTLPLFDLHAHTHWQNVSWVPFVSPPFKLADIVANMILYAPFGYIRQAAAAPARRVRGTALAAFALSFALEFSQLFSHSRVPSGTDLASNTIGAVMGAMLALRVDERLRGDAHSRV